MAPHAFVRAANGAFTTVDAPGAGTGPGQGTWTCVLCLNPAGAVTGNYLEAKFANHGFVRAVDGWHTTFDALGAGTGAG